ncbi:hypothetical protein NP493_420g05010 [Ridgeia piscesae]|uniref:Uncharacterized protein n=1 Tax=Ridgeia piscesae TaxID=27915 RepID=A0AAD9NU95_RIDPI|nr:hypothetical protein NP493_420g05010 [Ridgeia piscesae]
MASLKPHWGLWLFLVVAALQQPNAVTKDNEQVADDNKHGALVAVETEDDEEPVPGMYRTFGKDLYLTWNINITQDIRQWQTVRQGQAIPPGLHVRLNLETGQREAKLLESTRAAYVTQEFIVVTMSTGSPDRVQRMKDAIQQAMQQLDSGDTSVRTHTVCTLQSTL